MNKPLVSIGMPLYNAQKRLRLALDALVNQTFRDFELIISDNASTDDTKSICMEYASKYPQITYTRRDKNMGGPDNFKFVLTKATGTYFMWAAYDDLWDVNYLTECVKVFSENPDCVTVFSHVNVVDINTDQIIRTLNPSSRASYLKVVRVAQSYMDIMPNFIYGLHKTDIIRKIELEPFDWFDVHFTAVLALYGTMLVIPRYLHSSGDNHPRKPYSLTGKYLDFKTFRSRSNKLIKDNFSFIKRFSLLLLVYRMSFVEEWHLKKVIDNWPKETTETNN